MPAGHKLTKDRPGEYQGGHTHLNICLVTRELYGWSSHGDAASATLGLAQYFTSRGNTVTLIWVPTNNQLDDAAAENLRQNYSDRYRIKLEILTSSRFLLPDLSRPEKASAAVYYHLKEQEFDVLYFALEGGLAYYALLAKELGLVNSLPKAHVLAGAPIVWQAQADRRFLENLAEVAAANMEKYCIEQADSVIFPSTYLLDWIRQQGWAIAKNSYILPDLHPADWPLDDGQEPTQQALSTISEVAFCAGPEFHRGLTLFCDALDLLARTTPEPLTITLLGRFGRILGEHSGGMILRRSRRWPFELRIVPHLGAQQIVDYLKKRHCLAVFPYHGANTPCHIATCLDTGIPFVATDVGGIPEMIDAKSRGQCICPPRPSAIASRVAAALKAPRPIAPSLTLRQRRSQWNSHLREISQSVRPQTGVPAKTRSEKTPFVSILMVHHDRPDYLAEAVAAVEKQDYSNFELILVDDGSGLPESQVMLDNLEGRFKERGWRIIRQENKYLGAARNAGVHAARGERILFIDDDNALQPNAVSTFVRSMEVSGADICTAFHKTFYEEQTPADEGLGYVQYLPLGGGGGLDLGFIRDTFGDATAMVRREVFDKIGFQIEDYGYAHQDWEFFARAALAGLKIRVIPEPLYWYRSTAKSMFRTSHWYENLQPILAAYRKHGFAGLEHVYHLVLSANTAISEKESYRENLYYNVSNEQHLQLAKLDPESDDAINLLARIARAEGRSVTASLLDEMSSVNLRQQAEGSAVSNVLLERALVGTEGSHPRGGELSLNKKRARQWTDAERRSAKLVTKYPSLLPLLLFPRNHKEGLFLRPSAQGNVVALLPYAFPAFARGVVAMVEIAHEEASPFEFAMALSRLDEALRWVDDKPPGCLAFSGWLKVAGHFQRCALSMQVKALVRMHLSINLAVRLPVGSEPSPANAFWRELSITWDSETASLD